jgi:hypothetical protein
MSLYLHRQRGAQVLAGLEQFRQADIGVVRPAPDAARLLGRVVDARACSAFMSARSMMALRVCDSPRGLDCVCKSDGISDRAGRAAPFRICLKTHPPAGGVTVV